MEGLSFITKKQNKMDVSTMLLGLIILFTCVMAYIVYVISRNEYNRLEEQEEAYERYLVDNAASGYKLPPIDIGGRIYIITDDVATYTLKEWEEEEHKHSQYVSNNKHYIPKSVGYVMLTVVTLAGIIAIMGVEDNHSNNYITDNVNYIELTNVYVGM